MILYISTLIQFMKETFFPQHFYSLGLLAVDVGDIPSSIISCLQCSSVFLCTQLGSCRQKDIRYKVYRTLWKACTVDQLLWLYSVQLSLTSSGQVRDNCFKSSQPNIHCCQTFDGNHHIYVNKSKWRNRILKQWSYTLSPYRSLDIFIWQVSWGMRGWSHPSPVLWAHTAVNSGGRIWILKSNTTAVHVTSAASMN